MNKILATAGVFATVLLFDFSAATNVALAQQSEELEEVIVTGSRIRRNPLDQPVAIMDINYSDIEDTGLTNLGDALQQ
ncbi:MAG: hypothetical protein GTO41_22440, partial [Burkholderiales bacterium]|nr:hypothetical protein [Burkholderiales bacterium]